MDTPCHSSVKHSKQKLIMFLKHLYISIEMC